MCISIAFHILTELYNHHYNQFSNIFISKSVPSYSQLPLHSRHPQPCQYAQCSMSISGFLPLLDMFLKIHFYLRICMCSCMSKCHTCVGALRSQKRVLDSLNLELQVTLWVLGGELGPSGRGPLNH